MLRNHNKPIILILCYSDLNRDPRVMRQIEVLQHLGKIVTAGLHPSGHPAESLFISLSFTFKFSLNKPRNPIIALLGRYLIDPLMLLLTKALQFYYLKVRNDYDKFHWTIAKQQAYDQISQLDFNLIVANDISALPLAVRLKKRKKAKLCYDAHEYSPLEYDNDPAWVKTKSPYITFLCKEYMPQADYCTTIGKMIADQYEQLLEMPIDIIYNATSYQNLKPLFRDDNKIRAVHHGVAIRIRQIEHMIAAFKTLGNPFELHLYIVPSDQKYYDEIKAMVQGVHNIWFHNPVKTEDICTSINQYDILLNFIPPINFNYRCSLPNKFFEGVQARLMLVCGPLKEQEDLINNYRLGLIAEGFLPEHIVSVMLKVNKEIIISSKNNADQIANLLCAEVIMSSFKDKVQRLLN